jgi:hypothetical protein
MTPMSGEDPPTQQPQAPATPDTHPTADAGPSGLQGSEPTSGSHSATDATDNSDKTSAPPPEHHQGRIRLWLNKRRGAAEAEQAAIKSMKRIAAIILTALIGFFFGIANNQAADIIKRADECSEALTQYNDGVASEFVELADAYHKIEDAGDNPGAEKQGTDLFTTFNKNINIPFYKVINKCPVGGNVANKMGARGPVAQPQIEYLSKKDIDAWRKNNDDLHLCFHNKAKCAPDTDIIEAWKKDNYDPCVTQEVCVPDVHNVNALVQAAMDLSDRLTDQANEVSTWGLGRRGWYAVTHLW